MQTYKNTDSIVRNKVFSDSVYTPYKELWNGYLGNSDDVVRWLNKNESQVNQWILKDKTLNGKLILKSLQKFSKRMKKLTGYNVYGNWYILYSPAWTDLGGLGKHAMVIDLAHKNNSSIEKIEQILPHEFTHQIMMNTNRHHDNTLLEPVIGEGFAVWMNQKYWKKRYSLAQHLGYTDSELDICEKKYSENQRSF